jgi:uncharacterized repeat protein (TIGR01451 family)
LVYQLMISNLGPSSANTVRVEDTLPPGASFVNVSTSGSGWICNHSNGIVTCTRSNLDVGPAPTINIAVTVPNSTGIISNTANVVSNTPDSKQVNNSATEATEVTTGIHRVVEITLQTNDIIYDPVSDKIFASVPGSAGIIGDSITIIDPVTEQVGSSVFIGSDPGPLAISSNGQFIYTGLDGTGAIRRFDISSQTSGLEFQLESDPIFGQFYAEDIEVQPGDSSVVSVSLKYLGSSPRHAGIAVYDDGVKRPVTTPGHTGSNVIEYSGSPSTLFGYNNETTEFGFRTMVVDASGVSVSDATRSLVGGFGVDIEYNNGRIYSTTGSVIDPVGLIITGTFAASGLVEPDSTSSRVFFLTAGSGSNRTLQAYDINTFQFMGSLNISGVNGNATTLIRWGDNGIAFNTDQSEVFIIQTSLIP